MRSIGLGMVIALAISSQSFAQENKDKPTQSSVCAKLENSDVSVRKDGVYANVNATMENGLEKKFLIKKNKKNDSLILMVDGKKHEIQYKENYIYKINEYCSD